MPAFVSVGIALFIVGFLMTVIFSAAGSIGGSTSSDAAASESADSYGFESLLAFLGVFVGLLGVVTATIGPLTTVVVAKGRR